MGGLFSTKARTEEDSGSEMDAPSEGDPQEFYTAEGRSSSRKPEYEYEDGSFPEDASSQDVSDDAGGQSSSQQELETMAKGYRYKSVSVREDFSPIPTAGAGGNANANTGHPHSHPHAHYRTWSDLFKGGSSTQKSQKQSQSEDQSEKQSQNESRPQTTDPPNACNPKSNANPSLPVTTQQLELPGTTQFHPVRSLDPRNGMGIIRPPPGLGYPHAVATATAAHHSHSQTTTPDPPPPESDSEDACKGSITSPSIANTVPSPSALGSAGLGAQSSECSPPPLHLEPAALSFHQQTNSSVWEGPGLRQSRLPPWNPAWTVELDWFREQTGMRPSGRSLVPGPTDEELDEFRRRLRRRLRPSSRLGQGVIDR